MKMLMVNKYVSEKALSEFTCNESNWLKNKGHSKVSNQKHVYNISVRGIWVRKSHPLTKFHKIITSGPPTNLFIIIHSFSFLCCYIKLKRNLSADCGRLGSLE